jgi:Mn2+/Fe2+ NRAMP family transporter
MAATASNPPPNWVVGCLVALLFILVTLVSSLEKAFACALAFGVFAAVVQTKWESRRDWRVITILVVFGAAHLIAILVMSPAARHCPRLCADGDA